MTWVDSQYEGDRGTHRQCWCLGKSVYFVVLLLTSFSSTARCSQQYVQQGHTNSDLRKRLYGTQSTLVIANGRELQMSWWCLLLLATGLVPCIVYSILSQQGSLLLTLRGFGVVPYHKYYSSGLPQQMKRNFKESPILKIYGLDLNRFARSASTGRNH